MDTSPAPATPQTANIVAAVLTWLDENPGLHRPTDVARSLGEPTQRVANTLLYLAKGKRVTRVRPKGAVNGNGASRYRAKGPTRVPPTE